MDHSTSPDSLRRVAAPALCTLALLTAPGCGPSAGGTPSTTGSAVIDGEEVEVRVDPNSGGKASSVRIAEILWGRLVDVFDAEDHDGNPQTPPLRTLIRRDFLISENVITDGVDYLLETSPFTNRTELTILADADSDDGVFGGLETQSERFERLLDATTTNLGFVTPKGTGASAVPPFPLVPRNAALSIRMSDLLDHASIGSETVRVFTGTDLASPANPRILPDPNHGAIIDIGGQPAFRTTRILVDFTVSEAEAQTTTAPVNSIGLPPSTSIQFANAVVRIPTRTNQATGQFQVVRNLAGKPLALEGNAPFEATVTADVVRTFRTGRSDDEPGNSDPNNGFLLDIDAPQILGSQPIRLAATPVALLADGAEGDAPGDQAFLVDVSFDVPSCAQTARAGDILRLRGGPTGDLFARVTRQAAPPNGGALEDLRVRLLPIPAEADAAALRQSFLAATIGEFQSTYRPGPGVSPTCFLSISPIPGAPPVDLIDTQPQITVRFSEPMNPETVTAHESFRIDAVEAGVPGPTPQQSIVGQVTHSSDLREFRFSPVVPIDHVQGLAVSPLDELFLTLLGGERGVRDLAGNGLADPLPADLRLTVDPARPTQRTGGVVLTFEKIDEDSNTDILMPDVLIPEIRGQFIRDLDRGVILSREVSRDSRVLDRTNPLIANMFTSQGPVITPLVPLGSRLMTVWRYADVGFEILDENTTNVDVEGINYAPFGGAVSTDFFALFEIGLAHSAFQPDEYPIPINQNGGGYAMWPNSGLNIRFADNVLDDPLNPVRIVHPRTESYLLSPAMVFTATTGTQMMPYPLNRSGKPVSQFEYFTWRDTAVLATGGTKGFGADVKALETVGLACMAKNPTVYEPGSVRSIALPLLMDFKCFQDDLAGGLNGLDTSFALPTERLPAFRVYSSGGFDEDFAPHGINPDSEDVASAGYNGQTGAKLINGDDNTFMLGQLDLVVRVSRVHTIWFDTWALAGSGSTEFLDPVLEPDLDGQPAGTSITLAFRGATDLQSVDGLDFANATLLDPYGDPLEIRLITSPDCTDPDDDDAVVSILPDFDPVFLNDDPTWHADLRDLDGARYVQARVTFVANTATGDRPVLSTLALPYRL